MNCASSITTLLLRQSLPELSRSQWRWEFVNIIAAVVLLSVAFAAIAFFFFRRRTRDLTLIYFGLFGILYAVRLLAGCVAFRSLFSQSAAFWDYVNWIITCTIILPCGFFLYQVVSDRLRRFFRWLLAAQAAFAVFGVFAAALGASLARLHTLNSLVVLATFVVALLLWLAANSARDPQKGSSFEVRIFLAGFAVWGLFVLHANLLGLRILRGHNVEFAGLLVFVACLGYISARRALVREEQLLALSKELEIARRIQSSILPQAIPQLDGLAIAARYVPMSAVAGDFYDFLLVDKNRLGVLVADVTGHGVPAALIASMLKVAFAGQFAHAEDPARLLAGLNRALCGKFAEHFVTAAYLFVDLQSGVVRYAAAGHPPLLFAGRNGGAARNIEANGLILGLFPDAEYVSTEFAIGTGSRGLLYTDGILEAQNAAAEEFGLSRCKEFLERHSTVSPDRFADALLTRIATFAGHNSGRAQEDDITFLVLDFQG